MPVLRPAFEIMPARAWYTYPYGTLRACYCTVLLRYACLLSSYAFAMRCAVLTSGMLRVGCAREVERRGDVEGLWRGRGELPMCMTTRH